MSLATLSLHGNVGGIQAAHTLSDGRQIQSFSLAKTEAETVNGETKYTTTWYKVVTTDQFVLEKISKLAKGDEVIVVGNLKVRPYQTRDGRDQFELRVTVLNSSNFSVVRAKTEKPETADQPADRSKEDMEIPF